MTGFGVNGRWLLAEALRIGTIVLVGFLLAHLLGEAFGAFGIGLLHGLQEMLVSVIQFTTLLTALLYSITTALDAGAVVDRGSG